VYIDLFTKYPIDVVIGRADTAASITHLVSLLRSRARHLPGELRVLDLCTGSGCMALLFEHEFARLRSSTCTHILGVDISLRALRLARLNRARIHRSSSSSSSSSVKPQKSNTLHFLHADILLDPADQPSRPHAPPLKTALFDSPHWHILLSNPPYISPRAYWTTTARSVRGFEPRLALVPPPPPSPPITHAGVPSSQNHDDDDDDAALGDTFYPRLLAMAQHVNAQIVLLEVADMAQAVRVARRARCVFGRGVEIWREEPGVRRQQQEDGHGRGEYEASDDDGDESGYGEGFRVLGRGNARSVVCWRGEAAAWLGRE